MLKARARRKLGSCLDDSLYVDSRDTASCLARPVLLTPFGSADLDFSTLGTDSSLMISLNERKQRVQSVSL